MTSRLSNMYVIRACRILAIGLESVLECRFFCISDNPTRTAFYRLSHCLDSVRLLERAEQRQITEIETLTNAYARGLYGECFALSSVGSITRAEYERATRGSYDKTGI